MRIALDAMGTDTHPRPDVAGGVLAARMFGGTIILVGDEQAVQAELSTYDTTDLHIEIHHANEAVTMTDKPNEVLRGKKQSSIHIGTQLVADGEADAFVTAGNTGAALAISMFTVKRIEGVKRPAITAVGELNGSLVTIIDVGANTDTKLDWLQQFALMGHVYAEQVLQVKQPRVGLLANGTEGTKGNQLVRDANPVFQNMPINFVGNIEPGDIFEGKVDVVVTDGYVGNILLKTFEATMSSLGKILRRELTVDWRAKLGAWLLRPYLHTSIRQLDPTQYGGAPLLGLNGIVIITHGGASAEVIRDSVGQARKAVQADVIRKTAQGLMELNQGKSE